VPVEIEVKLGLVNAKPPLKALADVLLRCGHAEITIRRCAVFQRGSETAWTSLPRLPIEKLGKKQFLELIDLPPKLKQEVSRAILTAYEKSNAR
jgi:hypothetical protein